MMLNLSLIIPLYNSSSTIIATLESLLELTYSLSGGLIFVDDASQDNTKTLVKNFIKKKKIKAKFYQLKKNSGAGFAKDYGIKKSSSKYIMVCDSDNIFECESIKKLYYFLLKNKSYSAAHFNKNYTFVNHNSNIVDTYDWGRYLKYFPSYLDLNQAVRKCALLDNIMMTKSSYLTSGGYPKNHGFDTQGLSINYLLANHKLAIIKDTFYYHRTYKKNISYYQREKELGRLGINWYLAIEPLNQLNRFCLINFFKNNIFNLESLLHLVQNFSDNPKLNKNDLEILKIYKKWYRKFKIKDYKSCLNLSYILLEYSSNSNLAVYLLLRSAIYYIRGFNTKNDIQAFLILKNFLIGYQKKNFVKRIFNKISLIKNKFF